MASAGQPPHVTMCSARMLPRLSRSRPDVLLVVLIVDSGQRGLSTQNPLMGDGSRDQSQQQRT